MGLLTLPFKLPLLPVQAIIRLGEIIQEQAERELYDPAMVQRELEEAERQHAAGLISDEELSQLQRDAIARLSSRGAGGTGGSGGSDTADPGRTIGGSWSS